MRTPNFSAMVDLTGSIKADVWGHKQLKKLLIDNYKNVQVCKCNERYTCISQANNLCHMITICYIYISYA